MPLKRLPAWGSGPARAEECLHELAATRLQYPADHLEPMVKLRGTHDIENATRGTCSAICGTEYEPGDPRVNQRPRTHRTRLHGHVKRRANKSIIASCNTRCPQRPDLGVRARVGLADRAIPALTKNLVITNQDRPDRDFTRGFGARSEFKRPPHPLFVGGRRQSYSHSIVAGGLPEIS
jgi:hypothetical protein